jgi:uncharacterized protein with ParB-like and HNH nuclease domain
MQAVNSLFTGIINGNTQFAIPVFQRDYSWTEDQCAQLWEDIQNIAGADKGRHHFLGSVVYISTGDSSPNFTRWLLIDGQQRVTTLVLLLAALRDTISDTGWKGSSDGPTAPRVERYFLKNPEEEGERVPKLVLRRHDQATLRALLDRAEMPPVVSERIRDNYDWFRAQLEDADPEAVYRGVGRLAVVNVTLERGLDDPQLIFESLNSTGIDLSQSDLIRNFILMGLEEREQTRLYERYWQRIEALFRGSEKTFDAFARDYLALQTQATKQGRADEIYSEFRRSYGCHRGRSGAARGTAGEASSVRSLSRGLQSRRRGTRRPSKSLLRIYADLVDVPAILIMRLFECYGRGEVLP